MRFLLTTIILLGGMIFFSCNKEKNTPSNIQEELPSNPVVISGTFVSNAHTTSGMVKIMIDSSAGKTYLAFEKFKTDNGPDLRVWLSPNLNGSPYTEVGKLKAISGDFVYEIPSGVNFSTNNHVLIWCEDFSVLFGHAVLQ